MKKAFAGFMRGFGTILSVLYPYKLQGFVKKASNLIYSGFIKGKFKSVGENFNIAGPVYVTGGENITIGDNFTALPGLWIDAISRYGAYTYHPQIAIGNNVIINLNGHIGCINKVSIGNNVLIASKVYITDHSHGDTGENVNGTPVARPLISKGPVSIADNVWIGDGVVIMPNVSIGENCIVGANSVVTKSFPANSIIAGVPAKLIKVIEPNE